MRKLALPTAVAAGALLVGTGVAVAAALTVTSTSLTTFSATGITVPIPAPTGYIVALAGTSTTSSNTWSATATARVTQGGEGLNRYRVTGRWTYRNSPATELTMSCTTGTDGNCTTALVKSAIQNGDPGTAIFTVSTVENLDGTTPAANPGSHRSITIARGATSGTPSTS